jgi:hypothetical protein
MSAVIQVVLRMPARFMNENKSAISSSRPRGSPSPCETESELMRPSGWSVAIPFQVARDVASSRFSHATCAGPRKCAAAMHLRRRCSTRRCAIRLTASGHLGDGDVTAAFGAAQKMPRTVA